MATFLSAQDAAARLAVSRTTLYAYVSRGMIRSQPVAGTRRHEYLADDVERLMQRRRGRRDPGAVAREALDVHGMPVLASGLTLIEAGRLFYRGRDAVALAREITLEATAALLWDAPVPDAKPYTGTAAARRRWAALPFIERCHAYLAQASAADPAAYNLQAAGVRRVGAAILRGLAGVAVGHAPDRAAVTETLAQGWGCTGRGRAKLETALVLSADHELNVSAFTARCVASAGATPYMAVTGALAALQGHKHGGHTARIADLIDERGAPRDVLIARLRRGDTIPGFGHPLSPDGDPRGAALMKLCTGAGGDRARAYADAAEELLGATPNLDYGLVALARVLGLPADAPLILFALGRAVGWIGHSLEQYAADQLIRPRARYTGPAAMD